MQHYYHRKHGILFVSIAVGCISGLSAQTPSGTPDKCPGTVGLVSVLREDSVLVKTDAGTTAFQVTGATKIWRGGDVPLSRLRLGDSVMVWCRMSPNGKTVATDIMANFTRWAGTITAVYPHSFVIVGDGGPGEAPGHVRGFLDSHITYAQGTPKDLTVGRDLEVSGWDIGHKRVKASALNIWPSK